MSYDEVKRLLQMINIDLSEHYALCLFKVRIFLCVFIFTTCKLSFYFCNSYVLCCERSDCQKRGNINIYIIGGLLASVSLLRHPAVLSLCSITKPAASHPPTNPRTRLHPLPLVFASTKPDPAILLLGIPACYVPQLSISIIAQLWVFTLVPMQLTLPKYPCS